MKTLIIGSGPIGQWLALRFKKAGENITLMARNETYHLLQENGIRIKDGLTGKYQVEQVKLINELTSKDYYELVIVAMRKSYRLTVCEMLAKNENIENILFLGNDVSGFQHYFEHIPANKILLGFPGAGGGWKNDELTIMDRKKRKDHHGEIFFGELDGFTRKRTLRIKKLFKAADIKVSLEKDMSGWLKYHFAFIAPTTGAIFMKNGDLKAVAADKKMLHHYCKACREAGNVLRTVGYRRRQPRVFNIYYWLPRWLEAKVFKYFFSSPEAEILFGLHASEIGPELLKMTEEFNVLKSQAKLETPALDALIKYVQQK